MVGSFPFPVLSLSFLVLLPTCPTSLSFNFPHDLHIPFVLADSRQQVSLLAQRLSGGPGSDLQNHVAAGSGQVSDQVGVGTCVLCSRATLLRARFATMTLQRSFSPQERSAGDPSQPRPNPPTFAQGVISEYGYGEECAREWLGADGGGRGILISLLWVLTPRFFSQMRLTSGSMRNGSFIPNSSYRCS